jgi:hypothetical protein
VPLSALRECKMFFLFGVYNTTIINSGNLSKQDSLG